MTKENEVRPFYKRNWFWIMLLSIFIIVSATTYVANFTIIGQADRATASQSKNVAQKKHKKNPTLIERYNSIKTGKKNFTKDEIITLLGKPTSVQQINTDNQLMNMTWNLTNSNNDVTIQITFENNKAVAKSIQGLDIDRQKLLTADDYSKLQSGDSYNKVINVLGDPDDYSYANGVKTLMYESNLDEADPTQDALIKVEISNNKIIYTEQQNLK